jgi:excisionase family DNA binding protein
MANQRLFRIREAAPQIAFTEKGLRNLISQGLVDVVKIGRSVRIPAEELDRICNEGFQPARKRSAA